MGFSTASTTTNTSTQASAGVPPSAEVALINMPSSRNGEHAAGQEERGVSSAFSILSDHGMLRTQSLPRGAEGIHSTMNIQSLSKQQQQQQQLQQQFRQWQREQQQQQQQQPSGIVPKVGCELRDLLKSPLGAQNSVLPFLPLSSSTLLPTGRVRSNGRGNTPLQLMPIHVLGTSPLPGTLSLPIRSLQLSSSSQLVGGSNHHQSSTTPSPAFSSVSTSLSTSSSMGSSASPLSLISGDSSTAFSVAAALQQRQQHVQQRQLRQQGDDGKRGILM